jgi:phage-related protein
MMSRRRKDSGVERQPHAPSGSWSVRYHPEARAEVDALPVQERKAIDGAVDKLASLGPLLPFPHSSKVMGDPGGSLRELRPRAGRSAWRCIYERIGDVFVIGAIAPEAQKNKAGFDSAAGAAKTRLAEIDR